MAKKKPSKMTFSSFIKKHQMPLVVLAVALLGSVVAGLSSASALRAPTNVRFDRPTENSVGLFWTTTTRPVIRYFQIEYTVNGGGVTRVDVPATFNRAYHGYTIAGLTPCAAVTAKVLNIDDRSGLASAWSGANNTGSTLCSTTPPAPVPAPAPVPVPVPAPAPTPTPTPAPNGSITKEQAIAIANDRLPNKTVEDAKYGLDGGVYAYSVRYTDGSRVDVRASDGAILRVESR